MNRNLLYPIIILFLIISCNKKEDDIVNNGDSNPDPIAQTTNIVIFYTNDEHGWMETTDNSGGAAGMFDLWKTREGYNGADSFLILSGGDMWTGPAISTWFKGESMVEVMNEMEYDAAALGNHEFDFDVDGLISNKNKMDFPILAANVTLKSNGEVPDFIQPYLIKNINGVKVGIIGLASRSTPTSAFPTYVEDFNFTDYDDAIETYAPELENLGVDIIIITGHFGESSMRSLTNTANNYNVSIIAGGHSHGQVNSVYNGIQLIESGSSMRAYNKVVIEYNLTEETAEVISSEIVSNNSTTYDAGVASIIDYWEAEAASELNEVIGYCSSDINRGSSAMGNMITDSWLVAYPQADIAMTNSGGIRQNILSGEITIGDIVGVLPFSNTLYELELTGEEVIDCIDNLLIGGMTTIDGYKLADGTPIDNNTVYSVLTTDYIYVQPNSKFAQYDPDPYNTSIGYYQPTVDWIRSMNTTQSDPLNNYLDYNPRK